MPGRPTILIAAPAAVFGKMERVLAKGADLENTEDFEGTASRLAEGGLDLFILCYIFDDLRPYRILNYLQEHEVAKPTTVLVRALPVPLREKEEDVELAYRELGVARFVNLSDAEQRDGPRALARFADLVFSLVRAPA